MSIKDVITVRGNSQKDFDKNLKKEIERIHEEVPDCEISAWRFSCHLVIRTKD